MTPDLIEPAPTPVNDSTNSFLRTRVGPSHTTDSITAVNAPTVDPATEKLMQELESLIGKRKADRAAIEAGLFNLHLAMAGRGRDGEFTAFLRDRMGWEVKRPYNKAMRWIANHELREGLITKEEHTKRQGNHKVVNTPLRGASAQAQALTGVGPATPASTQVLTELPAGESTGWDLDSPLEIDTEAGLAELKRRQPQGLTTVTLKRMVISTALKGYLTLAERIQRGRLGTKTYSETMQQLLLRGRVAAAPGDEWGEAGDEICLIIANDPDSAMEPDSTYED